MNSPSSPPIAFVTGATGLLGSNLVRQLVARGVRVRALIRDAERARRLMGDTPAEWIVGDLTDVPSFAPALAGVEVIYHTAAYFRDSYKGGKHAEGLQRVNVEGTRELLRHAYAQGVRRFVHTSSIAVLERPAGVALIDESMLRPLTHAPDDYYRSKIWTDAEVEQALGAHPDLFACFVLPGFMNGPGDAGPTSAGQIVLDFARGKLPGALKIAFSYVDVRDVAETLIRANEVGRRGERYLAAGRAYTLQEALTLLASALGIAAPRRTLPDWMFGAMSLASELYHRITGKPVLTSWAGFRTSMRERHSVHFDNSKTEKELGITFRPLQQTFEDAVRWYEEQGQLAPRTPRSATPPATVWPADTNAVSSAMNTRKQ